MLFTACLEVILRCIYGFYNLYKTIVWSVLYFLSTTFLKIQLFEYNRFDRTNHPLL